MTNDKIVIIRRDVHALLVPSGAAVLLHEGTEVVITQSLGNSYTVKVYDNLARIDAKDADAIGQKVHDPLADLPEDASLKDKMWALLYTVYDPEIPVNIVDLGLIYRCELVEKQGCMHIEVDMTLTAPGCGMGPVIAGDVKEKLLALPTVEQVDVEIVFDPPWDQSRMSDVAKLELGVF